MKKTRIRLSLFSLVLALVLFGLTIRLTGRDPLVVYWSILTGSFGSTKSFLNVLAYMLPLIMTGLGAAVALQSGVFNIGGEGQVLIGGLAAAACSVAGNYLGSGLVVHDGQKIVRPVVLVVLGILFIKILTGH